VNLDLDPDAAPSPERTLQLAEALPEIVRTLNHQTRHHEALRDPSDADRLLREISTAAGRLPQLLEQATRWLEKEQEAGRIEMTGRRYPGSDLAVNVARLHLEMAAGDARHLQNSVDAALSVTCEMAAAEDRKDGGGA
jgi:hypothetical protein